MNYRYNTSGKVWGTLQPTIGKIDTLKSKKPARFSLPKMLSKASDERRENIGTPEKLLMQQGIFPFQQILHFIFGYICLMFPRKWHHFRNTHR